LLHSYLLQTHPHHTQEITNPGVLPVAGELHGLGERERVGGEDLGIGGVVFVGVVFAVCGVFGQGNNRHHAATQVSTPNNRPSLFSSESPPPVMAVVSSSCQ
ncbi:hypothetical protein Tsubulata_049063, partial [Turnera subulata]